MEAVMQRLDKLEKENAELRKRVSHVEKTKAIPVKEASAPANGEFKGNPVGHVNVAKAEGETPLSSAGRALITKSGLPASVFDATTVNIYGHFDVSADEFKVGVPGQHWTTGVASNLSYLGFRVKHDLGAYGHPGFAIVGQIETQADIASTPSTKAALASRNSFVGLESPWGTIKLGKNDTPYKEATAEFDPFHETIADYNSIMGNTGGDGRAEFDFRAPHAIWYESPILQGFQLKAMISPGQNSGENNSNFPYGEYNCSGGPAIGNGSGFPGNNQGQAFDGGGLGGQYCNDGSFGTLYGASVTYHGGGFVGIASAELHMNTNRVGDIYDGTGTNFVLPNGVTITGSGVGNEWAVKLGGGYKFEDGIGPAKIFIIGEHMEDDGAFSSGAFNERNQNDIYVSATQSYGPWELSAAYTHAFSSPGSPGTLTVPGTSTDATPGGVQYAISGLSTATSQYSAGLRYNFSQWASMYLVGTDLVNGPGGHFCLGPSGHGYTICSRDSFNATYGGASIRGVSSGFTFVF
jgi:predicted porin